MKATEAKRISEDVRRKRDSERNGNIYFKNVLKEIKEGVNKGDYCVIIHDDLTDKDVDDLESLGYELKHEHSQNYKSWKIKW